MKSLRNPVLLASLVSSLVWGHTAIGGTMSYTGSGTYAGVVAQVTLGNGDTVTGVRADTVATLSTDPPVLLYGRCIGMGLIPVEGNEAGYHTDFYCTFRQNDEDAFDMKGSDAIDRINLEVIGGSGKWAGATGSGSMKREIEQTGQGTFTYQVKITTP